MAEEPVLEGTFLTHFVEELGQCVFFEHSSAAEVYGVECMIGCMLEAKIGVNAAVHLACAKQIITKIDLGGAVFNERKITVSNDPGLGIHGIQGIRYLAD